MKADDLDNFEIRWGNIQIRIVCFRSYEIGGGDQHGSDPSDQRPNGIKNVGFLLNLDQLSTYDYRNLTLPTHSGKQFLIKVLFFWIK